MFAFLWLIALFLIQFMNVKALHSFVHVVNVLGRLSEPSFSEETWKWWTFVFSSIFNSPTLQQCLSVESFCLRVSWVKLKLTVVSSRSLSYRAVILLGCLLSFPSPLSVFHVLHLLLEVWHPECWPEGSSLIHRILARGISWIIQMLVGVLLGNTPSLPHVLLLWIFLLFNFSL